MRTFSLGAMEGGTMAGAVMREGGHAATSWVKPKATRAAQLRAAAVTVGPSIVLDLLVLAATGFTVANLLRPRRRRPPRPGVALVTGAGTVAPFLYFALVRPWLMRWGATPEELRRTLPGDDLVKHPRIGEVTRAITINAPASEVWSWLVQFGQGRGGFYSYDWLENLAGLDVHSAHELRAELQGLQQGDFISSGAGGGWAVELVEPGHAMVLRPAVDFSMTWAFVVEPIDDRRSRLILRTRSDMGPRLIGHLFEIPHFIMERKTMRTLKRRAEQHFTAGRVHEAFVGLGA